MASLRDIKSRIKSIKNTQKITQAMKMVAAAKVKKAENKVKESRPFSAELARSFKILMKAKPQIANSNIKTSKAIENYPVLLEEREIKSVGILVVTSDKGLAGAYNANVIRRAANRVKELLGEGKDVKVNIVGSKGIIALKRELARTNAEIVRTYSKLPAIPTAGSASVIAEDLAELFVERKIDKIEIITTKFRSMLSYRVEVWDILPVVFDAELEEKQDTKPEIPKPIMIFEPTTEAVLQKIVPLYVSNSVYQALVEAAASELAARMQAMGNATTNANDMIQRLTIVYNKSRQASITQEIMEVVGGAEALRG